MKRRKKIRFSHVISGMIRTIIIIAIVIVTVYPFWHVIMYSLSDSKAAMSGGIFLFPRDFSLKSYELIFRTDKIFRATFMSLAKTFVGSAVSVTVTVLMAFPLAQKGLKGKRAILLFAYFPMLFGGGMIPTYLVVKELNLLDSFWAYVFPAAMSLFNMFLMRNYISAVPEQLIDASRIDGANYGQILVRVVLPLSKAAIATIALNEIRAFWNSYMDGVLYINDSNLELLQVYLRRLISASGSAAALGGQGAGVVTEESAKMTVIAIALIPVLLLYALLQKYFVNGMLVGAVKE